MRARSPLRVGSFQIGHGDAGSIPKAFHTTSVQNESLLGVLTGYCEKNPAKIYPKP